jgi:hypothetical protein
VKGSQCYETGHPVFAEKDLGKALLLECIFAE